VLAEWDLALPAVLTAFAAFTLPPGRWPRLTYRVVLAATCTLQVYLYALNVVSNVSWGDWKETSANEALPQTVEHVVSYSERGAV